MKEIIDKNIDISKLLALHLNGNLDEQEQKRLEAWLQEKDSHRVLFEQLKQGENAPQRKELINRINLDDEWSRFQSLIQKEPGIRSLNWRAIVKYAAIIALPILAATFLLLQDYSYDDYVSDIPVEIKPGTKSAELVLSTGERIRLGDKDLLLEESEQNVTIHNKDRSLNYITSDKKTAKLRYNYLIMNRGEEYLITLADGTKVWLNSESKLKFPTQFADNIRVVEFEGEGYFEVAKNEKAPFIVKTKQLDVEVLGTEFNLSAYADEESVKTALVEGSVKISPNYGDIENIIIKPDEMAVLNIADHKLDVEQVDAKAYGRWRKGLFSFNEESLEEIMRKLSRWYDISVFFEDDETRYQYFSGKLPRIENCNDLLEMIEKTTSVEFEIKDERTVIVKYK
ncbi:FecR family protein [Marinifilum sp.]|uniref:FecR family protein n=1 Tax=Marinifilum sp. TaxID=2033137 RepID=UPI003BADACFC